MNRPTRVMSGRDERGAVAVVFAILAVLMLSMAAIGVDLGNAMNRKKQTQTSSDFAALAGANDLPAVDTVNVGANTAILQAVADYINDNQPRTDGTDKCNTDPTPGVTPTELSDGKFANGEVEFPSTTRVKVYSPSSKVQFGLANAMGFSDTCVQSVATARISSGSIGMAPYYATTACDSGPQVLKSDAGGPSIPFTVPVLFADTDTNTSVLSGDLLPNQVPLVAVGDAPSVAITLNGSNLDATKIDKVGFFNSDQQAPVEGPITSQNAAGITVTVPNAVQSRQDVWWVRVHNKNTAKWSARSEARPLLVGEAVLSCDPESKSGNFGSIQLPHGNNNDQDDLVDNIQEGLMKGITLATHPEPLPADNSCYGGPAPSVWSTDAAPREGTNCVDTLTGLKAGAAYEGYLSSPDGKLNTDTSDLCRASPQNRPQRFHLPDSNGAKVNDDTLSCFLKDDTLHLSDTVSYNGSDSLFVQEIFDSPRFMLVPVLHHDPSGHKWMPIVGFVPGFITDEVTGSSRTNPIFTGQTDNGLVAKNKQLRAMRVFFFDMDALPPPPEGTPLQDYLGSGKKIITLVN